MSLFLGNNHIYLVIKRYIILNLLKNVSEKYKYMINSKANEVEYKQLVNLGKVYTGSSCTTLQLFCKFEII